MAEKTNMFFKTYVFYNFLLLDFHRWRITKDIHLSKQSSISYVSYNIIF